MNPPVLCRRIAGAGRQSGALFRLTAARIDVLIQPEPILSVGGSRGNHLPYRCVSERLHSSWSYPSGKSNIARPTTLVRQKRVLSGSKDDDASHEHDSGSRETNSPQDIQLAVDATMADQTSITTTPTTSATDLPGTTKGGSRQLAIVYTCKVCETRAAKQFTEQAYNHGVVMVRCPGCSNLHLIADRLGFFTDQTEEEGGWDIEKAVAKMGENIKAVNNDNVLELTIEDVLGETLTEAVKRVGADGATNAGSQDPTTTT